MKIYIPVRKNVAVWWPNLMPVNVEMVSDTSFVIKNVTAFLRRKDAAKWIEDFNQSLRYPIAMDIAVFEHKKKETK